MSLQVGAGDLLGGRAENQPKASVPGKADGMFSRCVPPIRVAAPLKCPAPVGRGALDGP